MPFSLSRFAARLYRSLFKKSRSEWAAVIICVLTALVFWLVRKMNQNYTDTHNIQLVLEYDITRYYVDEASEQLPPMDIKSTGWNLLSFRLGNKSPILSVKLRNKAGRQTLNFERLNAAAVSSKADFEFVGPRDWTMDVRLLPKE